jgi:hypothetical protein
LADEAAEQQQRSTLSLDRRVALLASSILVPDGALGIASGLIARTESADLAAVADALLGIN